MSKINSISKKAKTILLNGVEPIFEGKYNYNNSTKEVEELAMQRLEICKSCVFFKKEPIDFLRIQDEKIPELSEMYCEDCGCAMPYKIRQNKNACNKWAKQ